jgi:hypothetical protein
LDNEIDPALAEPFKPVIIAIFFNQAIGNSFDAFTVDKERINQNADINTFSVI